MRIFDTMKTVIGVMLMGVLLTGCLADATDAVPDRCLAILRAGASSENAVVRIHACEALIKVGEGALAEPQLKKLLSSDEIVSRILAARGLVRLGHAEAIKVIISALIDPKGKGRVHAAESLGKLGYKKAAPDIRKVLSETQDGTALWVHGAVALARFGDSRAVEDLQTKGLKHSDKGIRLVSAWGLGRIGHKAASDSLYQMSQNESEPSLNRVFAAWSALTLGGKRVIPLLIGFLKHKERSVRAYGVLALGENGVESARGAIERLLVDADEDVRVRAAEALLSLAKQKGGARP